MNIVILAPLSEYDPASLPSLPAAAHVSVIAWAGKTPAQATSVPLSRPTGVAERLRAAMSRTLPGRVLSRLTPLDPGTTFWRAIGDSDAARRVLEQADLVVAVERDAAYAAWRWNRTADRGGALPTVFGYPAARAQIERLAA